MPIELRLLAYSVALLVVLMLIQAISAVLSHGLVPMIGNRDDISGHKPFEGRARRALYNHIEAMAMFAPLILIAAQQGIHNDATVLGARLFFYARVAHGVTYLIGIPYVRTLVWVVGLVGTTMILRTLLMGA